MEDLSLVVQSLSVDFICFDTVNLARGDIPVVNGDIALVAYQIREGKKVTLDQDATSLILARALYIAEEAGRERGQVVNLNFNGQRVDPNSLQGFSLGYIPVNPYETKERLYEEMQRRGHNFRNRLNLTPVPTDLAGFSARTSQELEA